MTSIQALNAAKSHPGEVGARPVGDTRGLHVFVPASRFPVGHGAHDFWRGPMINNADDILSEWETVSLKK